MVNCVNSVDSSPTCASVADGATASLTCPANMVVRGVTFASYGNPTGTCDGGYRPGTCHASASIPIVEAACVNRSSCSVTAAAATFGGVDPCPSTQKKLNVKARTPCRAALWRRVACCCERPACGPGCLVARSRPPSTLIHPQRRCCSPMPRSLSIPSYPIRPEHLQVRCGYLSSATATVTASATQTPSPTSTTLPLSCVQVDGGQTASLSCPYGIKEIVFASYGTPTGSCAGGYSKSSCHASLSQSQVEAACVNKTSCTFVADPNFFRTDPCYGTYKRMYFR